MKIKNLETGKIIDYKLQNGEKTFCEIHHVFSHEEQTENQSYLSPEDKEFYLPIANDPGG
jgi:hypothetical protein